ncbi:hypothetical protein R6Q57_024511 [Mikania cordata]
MEKDDHQGCYCYFHPDEVFVGVCPLCLYERLIVVASKRCRGGFTSYKSSKPCMVVPKIFAIDYLFHRKTRKQKLHHKDDHDNDISSASQDDSFISIRFDNDNITGAWERGKNGKSNSIVEHSKPQWSTMRWRKRIGHVFQLITSRKPSRHAGSGRMVKATKSSGGDNTRVDEVKVLERSPGQGRGHVWDVGRTVKSITPYLPPHMYAPASNKLQQQLAEANARREEQQRINEMMQQQINKLMSMQGQGPSYQGPSSP